MQGFSGCPESRFPPAEDRLPQHILQGVWMFAELLYATHLPEYFKLDHYFRQSLKLLPFGNHSCWTGIYIS